jgi:hypothetical protein
MSDDSIETIRQKIAAPPPQGFGIQACATTLCRLRALAKNSQPIAWFSDAMETAQDMIESPDVADVAPLREALSLMLYSRAVYAAKQQATSEQLDKLLSVITKIEKLKSRTSHPRQAVPVAPPPAATRHIVELSVTATPPHAPQKYSHATLGAPASCRPESEFDPGAKSPETATP